MLLFCKETSLPAKQNDTARISSPTFDANTYCMSFYYHMQGQKVDTLNVIVQNTQDTTNETIVWSKKGTQGNLWINGKVNLVLNSESTVIFEGRRGTSFLGDIALDDISITDGLCQSNGLFVCDFEKDMCGFSNDTRYSYAWSRQKGKKYSTPGVSVDHTVNFNPKLCELI
jgi:hypothetical protein